MGDCEKKIAALQRQVDSLEKIVKSLRGQVNLLTQKPMKTYIKKGKLFEECLDQICNETGISRVDILARDRRLPVSAARQRLMVVCFERGMCKSDIARALNRDHSTIVHGISAMRGSDQ